MIDRPDDKQPDERLSGVLARYIELTRSGTDLDRTMLLAECPDLASELESFLQAYDLVEEFAAPLRREIVSPALPDKERPFGDYKLLKVLGRGGMGVVYLARQTRPDRAVAVKIIHPAYRLNAADVQRFRNEAEAAGQLNHPNIVPVYEVGEFEGQLYFSMRWMEGGSLADLPGRKLPPRDAAELVSVLARAIHYAHERGILHRDLKPSNVLLDSSGRPYVADFGLAKQLHANSDLTQTGAVFGTPAYMAPERAASAATSTSRGDGTRDLHATTAIDIYGLGAVLYFVLTGHAPFRGESPLATLAQVVNQEPDRPSVLRRDVDRDLEAICLKCLEKNPLKRYRTAADLADDLDRWLAGKPTVARPVGKLDRAVRWCQRNRAFAVLAGTLLLTLAGGFTAISLALVMVQAARESAERNLSTAREHAEQLRVRGYAQDLGRAYLHEQRPELDAMWALLERHRPRRGETDLRSFEWYYLHNLCVEHRNRRPVKCFEHPDIVYTVAISPDGRTIASGGADRRVRLWDAATGECLAELDPSHEGDVNWVDFSPDGLTLASSGEDDAIRIWDVANRRQSFVLRNPTTVVECVKFTPDGGCLVTTGQDGVIRVWNLNKQQIESAWPSHTPNVYYRSNFMVGGEMIALSPNGRLLVSAGHDACVTIRAFPKEEPYCRAVTDGPALAVAFSADGRRFAAATRKGEVSVWNDDGSNLWRGATHWGAVRSLCFFPGSAGREWLLSSGDDGTVRVWDAASGMGCEQIVNGQGRLWCLAVSPDCQTLLTAGGDHTVKLWPLTPLVCRQELDLGEFVSAGAVSVQYSPDGKYLAISGTPGEVGLWDVRNNCLIARLHDGPVDISYLSFSPDGRWLATGGGHGKVRVWQLSPGRQIKPGPQDAAFPEYATAAFSRDGGLVLANSQELVCLDWPSRRLRWRSPKPDEDRELLDFSTLACAADGTSVALRTTALRIAIYDLSDGTSQILPESIGDLGHRIAISPDGVHLAFSSLDHSVRLWNVRERRQVELVGQDLGIGPMAFTPDGRTLAVGTTESRVKFFQVATGLEIYTLPRTPNTIEGFAFSPDGQTLATAGQHVSTEAPSVLLWHAPRTDASRAH